MTTPPNPSSPRPTALDDEIAAAEREAERLRTVVESIQHTLRQGFGDRYMLNRIKNLVDDAIDGHATEHVIVTDEDEEADL